MLNFTNVLGKNYDEITQNLFGIKASKHIIFYKIIDDNYVDIIRILHERIELKKRITE
ncbi:type II toxin-antitoxin system RelE/ParE family toxin [Leeuwenhoekiella sp. A16]|uniref:type II toxin-antitoxin system RelE/ParE family toxin n=1 Tax=Leeuwenhoekiella sp. A16 TaxID=3141462 RepID=UPI003A803A6C